MYYYKFTTIQIDNKLIYGVNLGRREKSMKRGTGDMACWHCGGGSGDGEVSHCLPCGWWLLIGGCGEILLLTTTGVHTCGTVAMRRGLL